MSLKCIPQHCSWQAGLAGEIRIYFLWDDDTHKQQISDDDDDGRRPATTWRQIALESAAMGPRNTMQALAYLFVIPDEGRPGSGLGQEARKHSKIDDQL